MLWLWAPHGAAILVCSTQRAERGWPAHMLALFMMSPTQTAGHQMAELMALFLFYYQAKVFTNFKHWFLTNRWEIERKWLCVKHIYSIDTTCNACSVWFPLKVCAATGQTNSSKGVKSRRYSPDHQWREPLQSARDESHTSTSTEISSGWQQRFS